jgi:hypothetical protein
MWHEGPCLNVSPMTKRHIITSVLALTGATVFAVPGAVRADNVTPPAVPANLTVEAGHKPFMEGHATGTQNYECRASGGVYAWAFTGPIASVEARHGTIEHLLSGNPDEAGTARATWHSTRDGSAVWAKPIQPSDDPAFVEAGAVPWLLLEVVGRTDGPDGGDRLSQATYIHRVNTSGGRAPAGGCDASTAGAVQAVPYTADYIFYKDASND